MLSRPKVAVLREQGVNSHVEMAYAFTQAGFEACDVHMTDTFGLGVCNGCQMFAELADIIPGAGGLATLHHQPERALQSPTVDG